MRESTERPAEVPEEPEPDHSGARDMYWERIRSVQAEADAEQASAVRDGATAEGPDAPREKTWRSAAADWVREGQERLRARLEGVPAGESIREYPEIREQLRETLDRCREGVERWDERDRAHAEKWLGNSSDLVREHIKGVLERMDADIDRIRLLPLAANRDPRKDFAHVNPADSSRRIHVGPLFWNATTPPDTKAGILVHELSHFHDIAGTRDYAYGWEAEQLARHNGIHARRNADNIEYFVEEYS
jgi:hypothetical protein